MKLPGLQSLLGRLTWALMVLMLIAGAAHLLWGYSASQRLAAQNVYLADRDLARHIAEQHPRLTPDEGSVSRAAFNELGRWTAIMRPGAQVYVLDLRGRVVMADGSGGLFEGGGSLEARPGAAPTGEHQVALDPIRRRLDHERWQDTRVTVPEDSLFGTDPLHPDAQGVFSVTPLPLNGQTEAYLYMVLPSDPADGALSSFSFRRLTSQVVWIYWLAVPLLGGLLFWRLTSPIRKLLRALETDAEEAPPQLIQLDLDSDEGDELARLSRRFDALRITIQDRLEETGKVDQLRNELFAHLSHDLRTPLATLRGYLETLALGDAALSPEQRAEYLSIALRHSERLTRLVNELLELSKLDSQVIAPNLERIPMAELVQDNVQRFKLRAQAKEIRLRAEIDPRLPAVLADVSLMERALENLIENAIRHTDPNGYVTVGLQQADSRLRLTVADTGRGIRPDDLPFIFDRFYRGQHPQDGTAGAGLGLAITRRIAELHQSELQVQSRLGQGAVFSFDLNIAPRAQTSHTRGSLSRLTRQTRKWLRSTRNIPLQSLSSFLP